MKARLKGKIVKSDFYNGKYISHIIEPAADAYSQPQTYMVNSDGQLGPVGAEVELDINVRGFIQNKQYKDKDTGQMKSFDKTNVFFDGALAQARPPQQQKAG